ncbi:MAG: hypothetical protein PF904_20505 [Kiritimatiellae bacterium]|nr:hypothetical protein [Kiritimatiellia bacterium]
MKFYIMAVLLCMVGVSSADTADDALALAQRTLAYVEKSEKRPAMAAELDVFIKRLPQAKKEADRTALEKEIRVLRRKIIFSHPDLNFDRLLACQRNLPYSHATHMVDQYLGRYSRPGGAGLIVIDDWKTAPKKREFLKGKLPPGTTLNPDLHWDGDRVLFAFCDHTDRRTPLQKLIPVHSDTLGRDISRTKSSIGRSVNRVDPTNPIFDNEKFNHPATALRYFIYEAALDGSWVHQLTGTEKDPMTTWEGRQSVLIEDVDPCYLPDGGFAFTSTRCQGYGRCHGWRYAPSFMIHRADADGSNIRQLSFGEANEWEPAVLNDGRIAYTRWDYIDRNAVPWQSLWTMNPDGTGTAHFFGNYTPVPKVQSQVKAIPGTHVVAAIGGAHHFFSAGCPILIDTHKGEDGSQSITKITPEITYPGSPWKDTGYYANPFPVNDTLFFASYSPMGFHKGDTNYCSYSWSEAWPSNNSFTVYLVDKLGGREPIFADPQINTFAPIPIRKLKRSIEIPSKLPPPEKATDTGICSVENVYDCRVPIKKGSVKAMRLNQIITQWVAADPERNPLKGYSLYKKPIGTVPVNADGSVAFRMPAGVPVQLQALDENGMAVMTMRSFIYVQKGEQLRCVGCHENKMQAPPQITSRAIPVSDPAPIPNTENGVGYDRQARPVFDRYCISCHGLNPEAKQAGGLSLIGYKGWAALTQTGNNKRAPEILVARAHPYTETGYSQTNDYFAVVSRLTKKLLAGHNEIKLTSAEWSDLTVWMDLNAQELPYPSWNLPEFSTKLSTGVEALREYVKELFGDELARQPYEALVNMTLPKKSRILMAPLPIDKGGWGQIAEDKSYIGKDDPRYRRMEEMVRASFSVPPYENRYGTCNRQADCRCRDCWVWMGRYNAQPGTHGVVTLPIVGVLTNATPVTIQDSVDGTLSLQGSSAVTFDSHVKRIETLQLSNGAGARFGGEFVQIGDFAMATDSTISAASGGLSAVKTMVLEGRTALLFGTLKDGPGAPLAVQKIGDGVVYLSDGQKFTGPLNIDGGVVCLQDESAPFISGLSFFLDASEKGSLEVDKEGRVTEWKEQMTGAVLQQSVAACPLPVYQAKGINGKPAVYFDGLTNRIATAKKFTQQTVFIVNLPEGSPQYGGIWGAEDARRGSDYGIRCVGGNVWAGGTNLPHNYFNTFAKYRINGVEDTHFIPGQAHILCAQRNRTDQLTMPVALGSYFWPEGRSYKGNIGEVLAYNRILTEVERQAVENYLSEKWLGRTLHVQAAEAAGKEAERILPATADVRIGKKGTLDLNGKNLIVTALSGSGRIINSRSKPVTLTVTGFSDFVGEVSENVRIVTPD